MLSGHGRYKNAFLFRENDLTSYKTVEAISAIHEILLGCYFIPSCKEGLVMCTKIRTQQGTLHLSGDQRDVVLCFFYIYGYDPLSWGLGRIKRKSQPTDLQEPPFLYGGHLASHLKGSLYLRAVHGTSVFAGAMPDCVRPTVVVVRSTPIKRILPD